MPLLSAAEYGDLEKVKQLVAAGVNIDTRNRMNQNALYIACENGKSDIAEFLLKKGADFRRGAKPLIVASRKGYKKCVELLLRHGASVNCRNTMCLTPLDVASEQQNYSVIEILVDHGADISDISGNCLAHAGPDQDGLIRKLLNKGMMAKSSASWGALYYAFKYDIHDLIEHWLPLESDDNIRKHYSFAVYYSAKRNWRDILITLLDKKVDVNCLTNSQTPLYAACVEEHVNIVELLLSYGADPNVSIPKNTDSSFQFPLEVAAQKGNLQIVRSLVDKGATVSNDSARNCEVARWFVAKLHGCEYDFQPIIKDVLDPFDFAFCGGHMDVCEFLIEKKVVDIDRKFSHGNTRLYKAILGGSATADQIENLLKLGADAKILNDFKESVLHVLCKQQKLNPTTSQSAQESRAKTLDNGSTICKLLVHAGANVNAVCSSGETALYNACKASLTSVVQVLLEAGADVNLNSAQGHSYPLLAACESDDQEIIQMLLAAGADIKCHTKKNETVLHLVCKNKHSANNHNLVVTRSLLQLFVNRGVEINALTSDVETPLYLATKAGLSPVVEILLKAGAQPDLSSHKPPLIAACEEGHKDIVELLLGAGTDANISPIPQFVSPLLFRMNFTITVDVNSSFPLLIAAKKGFAEIVKCLLQHNALVGKRDQTGRTVLDNVMDILSISPTDTKYLDSALALLCASGDLKECRDRDGRTLLHKAAFIGSCDLINELLLHNAHVNDLSSSGQTALHFACENKHEQVVELLLQKGANTNIEIPRQQHSKHPQPPLCVATGTGSLNIVDMLLKNGADINKANIEGCTALHLVTKPSIAKILLASGADPCLVNHIGETPLSTACVKGRKDIVRTLLEFGVNPNHICPRMPLQMACYSQSDAELANLLLAAGAKADVFKRRGKVVSQYTHRYLLLYGWPALCIACSLKNIDAVQALLSAGADVNVTNPHGATAMHCALKSVPDQWVVQCKSTVKNCVSIIDCLLANNINVNIPSSSGKTPLYLACKIGSRDIAKKLLDHGADVNVSMTLSKYYPLLIACENTKQEVVDLLLSRQANPNVRRHDKTPLLVAIDASEFVLAKSLLRHGADVNQVNKSGNSSLHLLMKNRHKDGAEKMMEIILQLHAEVNVVNKDGQTPLYLVCSRFDTVNIRLIERLLSAGADPNIFPEHSHGSYSDSCMSPLSYAAAANNAKLIALLSRYGAKIDQQDARGKTALHYAVEKAGSHSSISSNKEIGISAVSELCSLEVNADVNMVNKDGVTPLYIACEKQIHTIVSLLLKHGADPNLTNTDKFPLCAACKSADIQLIDLLLAYHANPNAVSCMTSKTTSAYGSSFRTPLCIATVVQNLTVVEKLVKHGALVSTQDGSGKTALHYALDSLSTYRATSSSSSSDSVIEFLLDNGADPNAVPYMTSSKITSSTCDSSCSTPLCTATMRQNLAVVEKLLKHGALVNTQDKSGKTALHYALDLMPTYSATSSSSSTSILIITFLLDSGADANVLSLEGKTPLFLACLKGNPAIVEKMFHCGANANIGVADSWPLTAACSNIELMRLLLSNSADPNVGTTTHAAGIPNQSKSLYCSPLCRAVSMGNSDVVKLLLAHGAVVNAVDIKGESPLYAAVMHSRHLPSKISYVNIAKEPNYKQETVLGILLEHGADVNAVGSSGQTVLYVAVEYDMTDVVEQMLKHGGNPNIESHTGKFPLATACENSYRKLVELLLSHGANPNPKLLSGKPVSQLPLSIAAKKNNFEMLCMLLDKGALVNECDTDGNSPLHLSLSAFCNGLSVKQDAVNSVVMRLLECGADVDIINQRGASPLQYFIAGFTSRRHSGSLKRAVMALLPKFVSCGARIGDSFENLGKSGRTRVCLENFFISVSPNNFMTDLFKAGAGFELLARFCQPYVDSRILCNAGVVLCKAIILSGFQVQPSDLQKLQQLVDNEHKVVDKEVELLTWLNENRQEPASLRRMCRVSIRKRLSVACQHRSILPAIDQLPLPESLKQYIQFEGHLSEVDVTVPVESEQYTDPEWSESDIQFDGVDFDVFQHLVDDDYYYASSDYQYDMFDLLGFNNGRSDDDFGDY